MKRTSPGPRVGSRPILLALCAAVAVGLTAPEVRSAPQPILSRGDPRRGKVKGGLPVVFASRPRVDGRGHWTAAAHEVDVLIELEGPPDAADLAALEKAGAVLEPFGSAAGPSGGSTLAARVTAAALPAITALTAVRRVEFPGAPFGLPRPLDGTAREVEATELWRMLDPTDLPLSGAGMTVCDVDSGIDVFHPMFFRADGGYASWIDVNGDDAFTPGIDGIDLDGSGNVTVLRILDGIITNYWDDTPLFGSDTPGYQLGLDWLYADLDDNGRRDYGREGGFDDSTPSFGEPLFVADDVDGNGRLAPEEKLVGLGSSKIRAVRVDTDVYRRGENLVDAPRDDSIDHGTGASGVMVGGQRGLTTKVGLAPEAELIMCSERESSDAAYANTRFCVQEGARVVLHEYAPWTGFFLDGSSILEKYIDSTTLTGVAHINPAGNLSGSKKLYKWMHPAGAQTDIRIDVAANSPYGRFQWLSLTLLWRDTSRPLAVVLEDPTGFSLALPTTNDYLYQDWHDGAVIYAERGDSTRGTAKLDVYVFSEQSSDPPIAAGDWLARVTDPTPAGSADLEVIAYVMDELSGWGTGIHFPDHSSEEHLVGYPGTADRGIGISAYTGYGTNGGTPGERASYSGRGHRIDGVELLDVAGPDDPVTSGYRDGSPGRYFVYGGTSGASPHVAAVAALLFQANPEWTGVEVTEALRAGALADDATGAVPNDDWGYGKLRAYRSLYGEEPPSGAKPTITVSPMRIERDALTTVTAEIGDPDEPAGALVVDLDRDYDGVYEEPLAGPTFEVRFDSVGRFVHKVRVTDSTAREGATLARFEVVEPTTPPVEPTPADTPRQLTPAGGCGCTAPGARRSRPPQTLQRDTEANGALSGEELTAPGPAPDAGGMAALASMLGLLAAKRRRGRG